MAVMSKLSFRARTVDSTKQLPIIRAENVPDLDDYSFISRTVPVLPSGMEKDEETETHLRKALSALQHALRSEKEIPLKSSFIPVPQCDTTVPYYEEIYQSGAQSQKQYIHYQVGLSEHDVPEYDMDSEDEDWLASVQSQHDSLTELLFEHMMEKLERTSGQQVTSAAEARSLLKYEEDLVMLVYDYWLGKRLRLKQTLLPSIRAERRDGVADPYVAFRKRLDRVQTRKNRKNDESSYEKMLRLRRDFDRVSVIVDLMKTREEQKRKLLLSCQQLLQLRNKLSNDPEGVSYEDIVRSVRAELHSSNKAVHRTDPRLQSNSLQETEDFSNSWKQKESSMQRKRKKLISKRRESTDSHFFPEIHSRQNPPSKASRLDQSSLFKSSLDRGILDANESCVDSAFSFKRSPLCNYHARVSSRRQSHTDTSRYSLSCVHDERNDKSSTRCVGYVRRRLGRGGRVLMDRIDFDKDDIRSIRPHLLWLDHSYASSVRDPPNLPIFVPAETYRDTGSLPLFSHEVPLHQPKEESKMTSALDSFRTPDLSGEAPSSTPIPENISLHDGTILPLGTSFTSDWAPLGKNSRMPLNGRTLQPSANGLLSMVLTASSDLTSNRSPASSNHLLTSLAAADQSVK